MIIEYTEELGERWDKIIKEHKEHPLKPKLPSILADEQSILITIFSTKEKFKEMKKETKLSGRQQKIIEFIEKNGKMTTRECANMLNVSNDTALRELSLLKSIGIIEQKGVGRGIYYGIK